MRARLGEPESVLFVLVPSTPGADARPAVVDGAKATPDDMIVWDVVWLGVTIVCTIGTRLKLTLRGIKSSGLLLLDGDDAGLLMLAGLPAGVSIPKLPIQLPNTLMNSMPNQPVKLISLLFIFNILADAVALPLVALPAFVLSVTSALPDCDAKFMLLVIFELLFKCTTMLGEVVLWLFSLTPVPTRAAVVLAGALTIAPTQVPRTFTNTSMLSLAIIW